VSSPERVSSSSIVTRLLLASLLILPLFLGFTVWLQDRAFYNYQLESQANGMRLQQLLLARAVDWDGAQWQVDGLDELRFNLLRSGLYAFIFSADGELAWHSPSAELMLTDTPANLEALHAAVAITPGKRAQLGSARFGTCMPETPHFCHSTRVAWGSDGPEGIFLIVVDQQEVQLARQTYRNNLIGLSLLATIGLLIAQLAVVRWGLTPLRRLASAIGNLERGNTQSLTGDYPRELQPLTNNINLLLDSEKRRRERVRNTMDRLTHVLKTPLMLMRNSPDEGQAFRNLVFEQVQRMLGIVEGELAKARLDGRASNILGTPIEVRAVVQRIVDAYAKLPRNQPAGADPAALQIDTQGVVDGATFYGEERDLQDLFGTLLENALKYARQRIEVSASEQQSAEGRCLELTVADDGDGIPEGLEQDILQRGARADTANLGHGLGLSIVVEIVSAYGGSLHTNRSHLGGALFTVSLPIATN
jgi:two-component system sensor histidine kinase PhoQ